MVKKSHMRAMSHTKTSYVTKMGMEERKRRFQVVRCDLDYHNAECSDATHDTTEHEANVQRKI